MAITVINRYRGDTKPLKFRVSADGEAANITGYTFVLTVDERKNPGDETTKKFHLQGVLTDPEGGVVTFYPLEAQMGLSPGVYFYDIESVSVEGYIETLVLDKFIITQDITK